MLQLTYEAHFLILSNLVINDQYKKHRLVFKLSIINKILFELLLSNIITHIEEDMQSQPVYPVIDKTEDQHEPAVETEQSMLSQAAQKNENVVENSASQIRVINPTQSKKGPSFDQKKQKMERLISDSNKRRYRKDMGPSDTDGKLSGKDLAVVSAVDGPQTQQFIKDIEVSKQAPNEEKEDPQYSEICERYSNFAVTSNGSRINKEKLFNSTINISQRRSVDQKASTGPVNYLQKNKRLVEAKGSKKGAEDNETKPWHNQLRSNKPVPKLTPKAEPTLAAKVIMGKINNNVRSSSSAATSNLRRPTVSSMQREKDSRSKLAMSSEERGLKEDLKAKVSEKLRQDIKEKAKLRTQQKASVYSFDNTSPSRNEGGPEAASASSLAEAKPPMSSNRKKKPIVVELATAKRSAERNVSKNSSSNAPPAERKALPIRLSKPTVPQQSIELANGRPKAFAFSRPSVVQSSKERLVSAILKKDAPKSVSNSATVTPSRSALTKSQPRFIRPQQQETASTQQQALKKQEPIPKAPVAAEAPTLPKDDPEIVSSKSFNQSSQIGSSTNIPQMPSQEAPSPKRATGENSRKSSTIQSDKAPQVKSEVQEDAEELKPRASVPIPRPQIKQAQKRVITQNRKSELVQPLDKEDIMNMDIETVWKEMEEIGRSKKAANTLFTAFQDKYFDKKGSQFNQGEVSPTKRLVAMKNATTKHHVIEYRKGITGRYAIQYTTCPEKSYVILPDEGQMDYDKAGGKQAQKFVEKLINGQVEKVELEEKGRKKKSNPNSRVVTTRSPVKINREHVARGSLIGGSFSQTAQEEVKVNEFNNEEPTEEPVVETFTEQDKPDIEIEEQDHQEAAQEQPEENEHSACQDDSIINICSNGVSAGHNVVVIEDASIHEEPLEEAISPSPIAQEAPSHQDHANIDTIETAPFQSDEQPIHIQNQSTISATHEEAIHIFDHPQVPEAQERVLPSEPVPEDAQPEEEKTQALPEQQEESSPEKQEVSEVEPESQPATEAPSETTEQNSAENEESKQSVDDNANEETGAQNSQRSAGSGPAKVIKQRRNKRRNRW